MGTVKTAAVKANVADVLARMAGTRVYLDTNIFVYFLERNATYFDRAMPFIRACAEQRMIGCTGDAAVAETLYKPYRDNDLARISAFKDFFGDKEFITVLPHDTKTFELTAQYAPTHGLKLMDALHCTTALRAGCAFLVTNDHKFASSATLEVVQLDALA